jgi:hypothetical protein
MLNNGGLRAELFAAHTALKGFLPRMNSLMSREPAPLAEGLSTLAALIWLVSSVYLLVLRKRRAVKESFATLAALIAGLLSVHFLVSV